MSYHRIIAIGGSAGAIEALRTIVGSLPGDFEAPICVVQHISAESPGLLPSILASAGNLPAQAARDGEILRAGHIYVAPPNHHLLIGPEGRMILGSGPKENRFRPAVDPLFRSAAQHFGPRAVGLVLSGGLDDGAAGLAAIKDAGGVAMVQQPEDARAPSMPLAALRTIAIDYCLPASQLAERLADLARTAPRLQPAPAERKTETDMENSIAAGADTNTMDLSELGDLSEQTCPDCGGVLRRMNRPPLRYRCHTGHAYTADTLADAVQKRADDAVWAALQRHNEEEDFLQDAIRAEESQGDTKRLAALRQLAETTARKCEVLRALLKDFGD